VTQGKRYYSTYTKDYFTEDSPQGRAYRTLKRPRQWVWSEFPLSALAALLSEPVPADVDVLNTHLAGIHLSPGEVLEIPVLIRMIGNGGKPGAGRAFIPQDEPEMRDDE